MTLQEQIAAIQPYVVGFDPATLTVNAEGTVNDVLIVVDRVFRFPKDSSGANLLRQEIATTSLLKPLVNVPIVEYDLITDQFASYKLISGNELSPLYLNQFGKEGKQKIAHELATFLKTIHGLDKTPFTMSNAYASPQTWQRLSDRIQTELLPTVPFDFTKRKIQFYLDQIDGGLLDAIDICPIHGDFGPWHVLVNAHRPSVTGIIDFGTFGIGDPAGDVAALLFNLGEGFVKLMREVYPHINQFLERARLMADLMPIQWFLRGLSSNETFWYLLPFDRYIDRID